MKKDIPYILSSLLMTLCVLCGLPAMAETVSQKQARDYAQRFFNICYDENVAPVDMVYNGKRLTTQRLFTPFYVYNEPRGGYVIISAENKVFPVLGYCLTEHFNPNEISEVEQAVLRNYALDIEEVRYNSDVPEQAIEAWRDYDGYVRGLLSAGAWSSEEVMSAETADDVLRMLWTTDSGLDSYADLYTPAQWQSMVDEELSRRGSAAIGYIDDDKLTAAVIHGRKGDYYKINDGTDTGRYMRLMAGELAGDRQLLSTLSPTYKAPEIIEERPFAFYDDFVSSVEYESRQAEENRMLAEMSPLIHDNGGGHFDVSLPEDVSLVMLYNVAGQNIGRRTYRHTNMAHINIEAEPSGFYFALIISESGRPYGIKLYR